MPLYHTARRRCKTLLALALLCSSPLPSHAVDPKFELDTKALAQKHAMPPFPKSATPPTGDAVARDKKSGKEAKAGAELRRSPARPRSHARIQKKAKAAPRAGHERPPMRGESRVADTGVGEAREIWTKLIPSAARQDGTYFDGGSDSFRLSLDPHRYPALPAQDGGRILVDGAGTLPPLVKALIQEKDARVRIVAENPGNRQRFYRSLLGAAQFYSFEDDFSVDFGADPKITFQADFKIEKNPDSLMRQDITLLNVSQSRRATPESLVQLLARHGFQLLEAGSPPLQRPGAAGDLLYQVTGKEPGKILDSLLEALGIPGETGRSIDLYGQDNIGIRLEVPVDRYFEDNGRRYVVAMFDGDPVKYTLFRLLETKGYRVITLQEGDDLPVIAEKVLLRLQLSGRYAEHELWPLHKTGYGVRLSGAMIRGMRNGDGKLFVTDRELDPLVQELAELNGYRLLRDR